MQAPQFDRNVETNAAQLIELAYQEDLGLDGSDVTALATIPIAAQGIANFVTRSSGVISGLTVLQMVIKRFAPSIDVEMFSSDGSEVEKGSRIARISGSMREILLLERTALNFLQRLSGISTLTSLFVKEIAGLQAIILDTRKTTPGWRALEKYAVRCGGGQNHRFGLYDAVLIKDNHLAWLGKEADPIETAIQAAREKVGDRMNVEVEVDTLEQLESALRSAPDIILVDNFEPTDLLEAVRLRDKIAPEIQLEASGGIRLDTVRSLALSGVNRLSIGALTHSAPALDIGLDYQF